MRDINANSQTFATARIRLGLTQEQLAVRADVDVKTVRKAENGKRIDLTTLKRLANALQVRLDSMIDGSHSEKYLQNCRREIVLRWKHGWDDQDSAGLLALYHDHAILRLPGGAGLLFGGEFRGKAEIRQASELAWATCGTAPVPDEEFKIEFDTLEFARLLQHGSAEQPGPVHQ